VPLDAAVEDILALEQGALDAAQGDYIAFLAPGDMLPVHAIAEIVLALSRQPETVIVFTDEDWIDAHGNRRRPRFKDGWDWDAQLGFDLMGRFSPMRREAALAAGGLRNAAGLAAHYALHCRVAGEAGAAGILHLASVLYHAAQQPAASTEAADAYAASARVVAQEAALQWEGVNVVASAAPLSPWFNRIEWPLPDPAPLVSILLPTRDRPELLEASALGVLQKTDYPAIELLILDNGSVEPETTALFGRLARDPRVRIMPMPGPFNYSKLNNDGAAAARGDILLLLNNDVEIIGADWLAEMVSLAVRPEIGCVGAKLLYADRRIQHAGVNMAPHTGCAHVGRLLDHAEAGIGGTLAVTRTHSAVTAACLAIRTEVFAEVGGLDEVAFRVGYNDVDLCLKVRDHGFRSVCSPFATLFHLESVSRGPNNDPEKRARERAENARIIGRWRELFLDDPCQNPNTLLTWEGMPRMVQSRRMREWEQQP
jgi:GT2 family glycosyltransferase